MWLNEARPREPTTWEAVCLCIAGELLELSTEQQRTREKKQTQAHNNNKMEKEKINLQTERERERDRAKTQHHRVESSVKSFLHTRNNNLINVMHLYSVCVSAR